jgi:hypothetical protein
MTMQLRFFETQAPMYFQAPICMLSVKHLKKKSLAQADF